MKRILIVLGIVLGLVVLVLGLGWWWLTATAAGAGFVLARAEGYVEQLDYRHVGGGLADGVVLEQVRLRQAGLEVAVDRIELAVNIDLLPLGVTVERLHLERPVIDLPPPAPTPAPAEPFALGDYRAPLPITIDELAIRRLLVRDADGAELAAVETLSLAARYAETLRIERLAVDHALGRAGAEGELGLASPWPVDLQLQAQAPLGQRQIAGDAQIGEAPTQEVSLQLRGPVERLTIALQAQGPAQLQGRIELAGLPAIDALQADVDLAGTLQGWPGLEGRLDGVSLQASGGPTAWQAELGARLEWPGLPPAVLDARLSGDAEAVRLQPVRVETLEGEIRVDGQLGLTAPTPTAQAIVAIKALDFTMLYPQWPAQARLSGGLELDWDGAQLRVRDLQLTAPPTPLTLTGEATLEPEGPQLAVNLNWTELRWPPVLDGGAEALFSSRAGQFIGSGTLDQWQAELEAWLRWGEWPEAEVELDAEGDASQAERIDGRIDLGEAGQARLAGSARWAEAPTAGVQLELSGFDPGPFVAALPGRIDASIRVDVDAIEPLAARIGLDRLDGRLRQVPLQGSGALVLAGTAPGAADLRLALGDNVLRVDHDPEAPWRLTLDADRLDQLWPELVGELRLEASVDPAARRAEWRLQGPLLAWRDRRASGLDSSGRAEWGETPQIDATVNAAELDLNPWERLEQVGVKLLGNCASHRLDASFTGARASLDLGLSGSLPDCLDQPARWSGAIERMRIGDTPVGEWRLDQALPVALEPGAAVRAGPGCLWTTAGPGRLCLNGLETGATSHAELALNAVPIDMLLLPIDPVFTLGSELRGVARIDWGAEGVAAIDAAVLAGPGALRMLDADDALLRIRGAELRLDSPERGALNSRLQLSVEEQSEVIVEALIPDLNASDGMLVDAEARLDLPRLAAFNRLLPQLDRMAGRLEAGIRVDGPIAAPDFDADLAIHDGEILYAPLGSHVQALNLTVSADRSGGSLAGGFRAGAGEARIDGRLTPDEAGRWRGGVQIDGQGVALFDVDWLQLSMSPDLDLEFDAEVLRFGGALHVDRARVGLPPGAEQRVAASDDVLVVDGSSEPEPPPPARPIEGTLALTLSDDVQLVAAGMETRLTGGLDLEWTRGAALPVARGRIRLVDGSYRAYGQNLEVTEGDVLFTGNPIDNPVLAVEAVRSIFGDPQIEAAGVRIAGPARNPDIGLFTTPPTSREKALAYILTGADFDHAAGQGAFSVGFWVLPRLFVSYGLGLFDSGNVLAARYDLSRRWGVRATSGERDTGADISFIIDR